jgi:hypothetical protein
MCIHVYINSLSAYGQVNVLCLCSYAPCHDISLLWTWSLIWTLLLKQNEEYLSSLWLECDYPNGVSRAINFPTVKFAAWNVTCCLVDQSWICVATCICIWKRRSHFTSALIYHSAWCSIPEGIILLRQTYFKGRSDCKKYGFKEIVNDKHLWQWCCKLLTVL